MKTGDKVVCIKDYFFCGNKYNLKNKIYTVVDSRYASYISVTCENLEGEEYKLSENLAYCVFIPFEFKKHFSELIEQRKLKLEKINEKR
jgi:hypothetical protein